MPRPFMLVFAARSGSTAIYGDLKTHPNILMRAEVFGNDRLPGDVEQTDDNRIAFLRKYWRPYLSSADTADVLSAAHGFKFQVDSKNGQFSQPMRLVKVAKEYSPAIIVLKRENRLKQVVSALNAQRVLRETARFGQQPTAHILPNNVSVIDKLRQKKMRIDLQELSNRLRGLEQTYRKLDQVANAFHDPLHITYEQFVNDRNSVIEEIMRFIDVDPAMWARDDVYQKITPNNLSEVVANYGALEEFCDRRNLTHML